MSKSSMHPRQDPNATEFLDPVTGEYGSPPERGTPDDMFEPREGRMDDSANWLPKITMKTIGIRGLKEGEHRFKAAVLSGIAIGIKLTEQPDTGKTFEALTGEFVAVRFGEDGEPDAVFKSDTIFLPIGHDAALAGFQRTGYLSFALEFSKNHSNNRAGYSWSYRNLAKLDRNNLSPIDRLAMLSVTASQRLEGVKSLGLLQDLRRH